MNRVGFQFENSDGELFWFECRIKRVDGSAKIPIEAKADLFTKRHRMKFRANFDAVFAVRKTARTVGGVIRLLVDLNRKRFPLPKK